MTVSSESWRASGRAWVFPEPSINTDVVMQRAGHYLPLDRQRDLVMAAIRPGWGHLVREGDVLVAGPNFGTGSSRPIVNLLRSLGIVGIVAVSVGEIFFRNCVSYAMPVLECSSVLDIVEEGDIVEFDISTGVLLNATNARSARGAAVPQMLLETIAAGGTYAQLRAAGYM